MLEFDAALRAEAKKNETDRVTRFGENMTKALRSLSKGNDGILVLRYLLKISGFLAPLTKETMEGVNKDLLMVNEAKRQMYLSLRAFMDKDTVIRIEHGEKQGGRNGGTS